MGTCYLGNEGVVQIDGQTVGGVRSFEVTETVEILDCTAMGDPARVTRPGQKSWNGTMTVMADPADVGQQAITIGAAVTLILYPEGDQAGREKLTGEARITEVQRSAQIDQIVEMQVSFSSAGELVRTIIS